LFTHGGGDLALNRAPSFARELQDRVGM